MLAKCIWHLPGMHDFSTKLDKFVDRITSSSCGTFKVTWNDIWRDICKRVERTGGNQEIFDLSSFGGIHAEAFGIVTNRGDCD